MGMADVNCAYCGHKMSKHTGTKTVTIVQDDACLECAPETKCALGLARRDDLEDKITDLEEENKQLKEKLRDSELEVYWLRKDTGHRK